MVEVCFPSPRGNSLRLKVTGHSGSDTKGKDLVCAAVSSLLHTMLGGLENEVQAEVEGTFKEGLCDVNVVVDEAKVAAFNSIAKVFRFGFEKLAQNYPTHIRIMN